MGLVTLKEILGKAEDENYAVGYFESWNLESLQAVWDAAEESRSPVILGFSGKQLTDPRRTVSEKLEPYAAMGVALCKMASVPTALIFNESPVFDSLWKAIDLGFNVVMFSDKKCGYEEQKIRTCETVVMAHKRNVDVEGELGTLLTVTGRNNTLRAPSALTDPVQAGEFVRETGVDALAVAIGNAHVTGAGKVDLDIQRLDTIKDRVPVPLVLHAGSGIADQAVAEAIRHGIRKINVGNAIRKAFLDAIKDKTSITDPSAHHYDIIGSGLDKDCLMAGRLAVKNLVKEKMLIYGSAGKA